MSFKIYITPEFKKYFKKLYKKHPSLGDDLKKMIVQLSENPSMGTNLGHGLFKVRMAISSKGKGKSGGARIITYLLKKDEELYLVYIYDKSQIENISKQTILEILQKSGLL